MKKIKRKKIDPTTLKKGDFAVVVMGDMRSTVVKLTRDFDITKERFKCDKLQHGYLYSDSTMLTKIPKAYNFKQKFYEPTAIDMKDWAEASISFEREIAPKNAKRVKKKVEVNYTYAEKKVKVKRTRLKKRNKDGTEKETGLYDL